MGELQSFEPSEGSDPNDNELHQLSDRWESAGFHLRLRAAEESKAGGHGFDSGADWIVLVEPSSAGFRAEDTGWRTHPSVGTSGPSSAVEFLGDVVRPLPARIAGISQDSYGIQG